jgi:Flp pilus assembly secretin CpaC
MRKVRESSMALLVKRLLVALMLAICFLAAIAPRVTPAADVIAILDQATLVRLPDRVATIVIGNPLIADASIQPGGVMVITGKGYGSTNVIVLDRAGAVLLEKTIEVRGPRDN